jgi:hypothetical protein
MSYIGRGLQSGAFRQLDDISSGFDGSDTTHTMQVNSTNVTVGDVNQILLSLGGVIQKPGTDFTVSSSTLTFTTAPAANTSFFAILLGSDNGGTVTPTDGSVTSDKLAYPFVVNEDGAAASDFRVESDSNTHMLFVDAGDDNVTLGVNNIYKNWYDATNTYEPLFQQTGSSFALAAQSQVYQNGANTEGPIKYFGKSRSAAGAVGYTAVADGDILGIVSFQGADGTHFMEGASIRSLVDGTPGVNDVPTNLQFFTNEGTSGASKRWTIETDGNLTPANTAYGIHLGVTTATASNLLDDYEEGTFTAAIQDNSGNSATLSNSTMTYRKVGSLVAVQGYISTTSLGSLSGAIHITGLPFTVPNANAAYASVNIGFGSGLAINANGHISGYFSINNTQMILVNWDATTGSTNMSKDELSADGAFILSGHYYVA